MIPDIQNSPSPAPAISAEENKKLLAVSKQFEAVFVNQMVQAMRKTVVKSDWMPESQGERVYRSMLDTEYAGRMAEQGKLGLSSLIHKQLVELSLRGRQNR